MQWLLSPVYELVPFWYYILVLVSLACLYRFRLVFKHKLDAVLLGSYILFYFLPSLVLTKELSEHFDILNIQSCYIFVTLCFLLSIFLSVLVPSRLKYPLPPCRLFLNLTISSGQAKYISWSALLFCFALTISIVPESNAFHPFNIPAYLNGVRPSVSSLDISRFFIYDHIGISFLITKLILPLSLFFALDLSIQSLVFSFFAFLAQNSWGERQGLFLLFVFILTRLALYVTFFRSVSRRMLPLSVYFSLLANIIMLLFFYHLNLIARGSSVFDFTSLSSSFNSQGLLQLLSMMSARLLFDPLYSTVQTFGLQESVSAVGIFQSLWVFSSYFGVIFFAVIYLLFSRVICTFPPGLSLISTFLLLYWIIYVDLISPIPFIILFLFFVWHSFFAPLRKSF